MIAGTSLSIVKIYIGEMIENIEDVMRTHVLDEPVSTMRSKVCEQRETWTMYDTS